MAFMGGEYMCVWGRVVGAPAPVSSFKPHLAPVRTTGTDPGIYSSPIDLRLTMYRDAQQFCNASLYILCFSMIYIFCLYNPVCFFPPKDAVCLKLFFAGLLPLIFARLGAAQ